jgi:hypothetical protein
MVILSLLAYGVYKEKQKLQDKINEDLKTSQSEYGPQSGIASSCETKSDTADLDNAECKASTAPPDSDIAKNSDSALSDRDKSSAASPSSAKSRGGTDAPDNATAKSNPGSAKGKDTPPLSESERRKKALQEWKEKMRAEMEKQQEDMEADSERTSHVLQDQEAAKAARMEKERQAEREKLLEKVQRMKREKAMERAAERAQQAATEPVPASAAAVKVVPAGKHELSSSEGEPKPKKLSVRSAFTAVNLEDTGVALPTAQPGPKNAIKFHLKSLVKPKADRIELVDLSGEEENEGEQLVKARNLLQTAQDRLGKNDIL